MIEDLEEYRQFIVVISFTSQVNCSKSRRTTFPINKYYFLSKLYMELKKHKIINIFHLLVVFPLILVLIYKDYFTSVDPEIVKNILRIIVTLGILNHSYKFMIQ